MKTHINDFDTDIKISETWNKEFIKFLKNSLPSNIKEIKPIFSEKSAGFLCFEGDVFSHVYIISPSVKEFPNTERFDGVRMISLLRWEIKNDEVIFDRIYLSYWPDVEKGFFIEKRYDSDWNLDAEYEVYMKHSPKFREEADGAIMNGIKVKLNGKPASDEYLTYFREKKLFPKLFEKIQKYNMIDESHKFNEIGLSYQTKPNDNSIYLLIPSTSERRKNK